MLTKRQLDDYAANEIAIYQLELASKLIREANASRGDKRLVNAAQLVRDMILDLSLK